MPKVLCLGPKIFMVSTSENDPPFYGLITVSASESPKTLKGLEFSKLFPILIIFQTIFPLLNSFQNSRPFRSLGLLKFESMYGNNNNN